MSGASTALRPALGSLFALSGPPRVALLRSAHWRVISRARLYSTPAAEPESNGVSAHPVASTSVTTSESPSGALTRPRPFEPTPALKRLLRGGERPIPMPYSEAFKGKKLIAVPVEQGQEPLYIVAPEDLPRLGRPWIRWAIVTGLFALIWAIANVYLANNVKLSSSVVQTLIYNLRTSPTVAAELGRNIRPVPFLLGELAPKERTVGYIIAERAEIPRIQGQIAISRGIVDISFDIEGSLGEGKVFFTSVRRKVDLPFEIVRWRVVLEDGRTLNLKPEVFAARQEADAAFEAKRALQTGQ